jgi:aryl-phospho-beta-D-glucosidase BglC (GH1 family)
MIKAIGTENYEYLFDRIIHHFFAEDDARFIKSVGLNSVRIPFSYLRFEDDMNPRVAISKGFEQLDRVVDLCSVHGLYMILDMHVTPGSHNPDWHSDNHTSYAAFWDYKDHQDRCVWLWEEIARRYKDNNWVIGINPLNEPCDPEQYRVAAFYKRLEQTIREICPRYIFFMDGNTFAMEWKGFDGIMPNSAYAVHDYSMMGFPVGERYTGMPAQKAKLRQQYARKAEFHHRHGVPVWVGEFGPTYEQRNPPDADEINSARSDLLDEQLKIFDEEEKASWCLWSYKDIGVMGMVYTSPDSAWMTLLKPFQEKKDRLEIDGATTHPNDELDRLIGTFAAWIDRVCPSAQKTYPPIWKTETHIRRNVIQCFLAGSLCDEFAQLFRGKNKEQLDELARSFAFRNCVRRERAISSLSRYGKQ